MPDKNYQAVSKVINVNSEFESEDGSDIVAYYESKTVFLTGATGFLGKLILEKILRTCKSIKRLYILVRTKKGVNINDRIEQLFSGPAMDLMKKKNPNFKDQVSLVPGDLLLPNLGMSEDSIQTLKDEVNIVIHCEATVRFDQKLKEAAYINVRSVKNLLDISKETKGLESFLYVSTAYSHCPRSEIGEEFYDPPIKPDALLELVEMIDENKLIEITPILLGEWPNTYTFTKAVSEDLIRQQGGDLPLAIVRPSIVYGAVKEPIPGWTDTIYGPSGILTFIFLGLLRTMRGNPKAKCDLVPVDYVVNCIITAAYQRAQLKSIQKVRNNKDLVSIYNYCYSPNLPPLTWGKFRDEVETKAFLLSSVRCVWYPEGRIRSNVYVFKFEKLLNMFPAYIADLVLRIIGKKPKAVKLMNKLFNSADVLYYFMRRKWTFTTDNTQKLFASMNTTDKNLFNFNMDTMDFEAFADDYILAIRLYIMRDPIETVEDGKRHMFKLRIIYYISWLLLLVLLYLLTQMLIKIWMLF